MSFRLPPSQLCRHYTQHVGRALCLEQTRLTRCKLKNSTESTTNVDCQFGSRSLQTLRRNNTCLHVAKNLLSGRHRLPQWHDCAQADTWSPCRGMQKPKRGSGPRGAPRAVFISICNFLVAALRILEPTLLPEPKKLHIDMKKYEHRTNKGGQDARYGVSDMPFGRTLLPPFIW